jgi:hypothetical protein
MATKSTNATIWTLALVGIAIFVAWKVFGKKATTTTAGTQVGGVAGDDYVPQYSDSTDPLSSLLGALAGLFGKGGGGSGGGSTKGPGNAPASSQPPGQESDDGVSNFINTNDAIQQGDEDLWNSIDNADQDIATNNFLDTSIPSSGDFLAPEQPELYNNPGTFIGPATDGSVDAQTAVDNSAEQSSQIVADGAIPVSVDDQINQTVDNSGGDSASDDGGYGDGE